MYKILLVIFVLQTINGFSIRKPIDLTKHYTFSFIILKQSVNDEEKFKELERIINDKIKQEKFADAISLCTNMEKEAINANSEYWQYVSYYYSGISTKSLKDYKTALNHFLKIIHHKHIPFREEDERMFKLFRYTGEVYKKLESYTEAFSCYKKCLDYKDKLVDKKTLVPIYASLGFIYSSQHNFINARECYLNGLSFAKDDDYAASVIYNNLGNDEYSQGNFSKAIEYYIQSIQLSEKLKDWEGLASSYNNLGNIYTNDLKDARKAIEFYTKSLDIEKKAQNNEGIAMELNNIGNVYITQQKYTEAEKSFKEALQIYSGVKNPEGIAKTLENTGNLYNKLGKYSKAIATFIRCIDIRKKNNDEINLANVYNSVGALYFYQKEYNQALFYYSKALEFSRIKNNKNLTERIYFGMQEAFAQLQQYDKAYTYLQDYSNLKDTLLNATISKQIIDIQEKYEKNKIQQQVALQTMEIKNKSLQRNGILAFLILAILSFSSILYIIFQKRKNEKLLYIRNSKIKDQEIKNLIQDSEIRSMVSLAEGKEKERKRISRELHDRVGSMLSLVKLNLSNYEEGNDPVIKENLILLDSTYQEVRNISHNLHSGLLNHFGLKAVLVDLKRTIESQNSIHFNLTFHDENLVIPKETEEVIFRVLQELITNVLKHSEAINLDIQVNCNEDGGISITVEDDGKGFDPLSNKEGIGLKNASYRLSSIGGSMEINSKPGRGSCFLLYIPASENVNKNLIS